MPDQTVAPPPHDGSRVERSSSLFRREAIDDHAQGFQDAGDVLRLSRIWSTWAFWLLAGLSLAAVLTAMLYPYREDAGGVVVALERDGALRVLLPARLRPLLQPGRELVVDAPAGGSGMRLAVRDVEGNALSAQEVRGAVEAPALLVTAVPLGIPVGAPGEAHVRERVHLAAEPLLFVLVPRLRRMVRPGHD